MGGGGKANRAGADDRNGFCLAHVVLPLNWKYRN
jgi:hypothetical protein